MAAEHALTPEPLRVEGDNGVGIRVWDYGGEGPALLLAHCTGTLARVWDPVVPDLLKHFRVIAPDTRGHGDSDKPEDPEAYHWMHSGRDLLAVVDELGLGSGILAVGHSAGATHICYAELERPGTFRRTVLIDPIMHPPMPGPAMLSNPMAEAARRRMNVFESREAARARFASKPPMNAWAPAVLDAYIAHGFNDRDGDGVELKCLGHIEAMLYEQGGASDTFERLHELELQPALVTGDISNVRITVEMQRDRFTEVQFHIIEDASHFIPQEHPAQIAQLIIDWLT